MTIGTGIGGCECNYVYVAIVNEYYRKKGYSIVKLLSISISLTIENFLQTLTIAKPPKKMKKKGNSELAFLDYERPETRKAS